MFVDRNKALSVVKPKREGPANASHLHRTATHTSNTEIEVAVKSPTDSPRRVAERHLNRLHCSDPFLGAGDAIVVDVLDDEETLRFSDEAYGVNLSPDSALELLASLPDGAGPEVAWKALTTGSPVL